jgi:hypothetical protein
LTTPGLRRIAPTLSPPQTALRLPACGPLRGSDAQVEQTIRDYLDANLPPHLVGIPFTYVVNPERTGIRVDVAGRTDTTLLEVVGIQHVDWSVTSEAVNNSIFTEIALVLDVTGSMRSHMPALAHGGQ